MTPKEKAAYDRARLADQFNLWLDECIPPPRKADGSIRKDRHGLTAMDDERCRALDPYMGGMKLAWHVDEFRRGELTSLGTVRVTIAVKELLEFWG